MTRGEIVRNFIDLMLEQFNGGKNWIKGHYSEIIPGVGPCFCLSGCIYNVSQRGYFGYSDIVYDEVEKTFREIPGYEFYYIIPRMNDDPRTTWETIEKVLLTVRGKYEVD